MPIAPRKNHASPNHFSYHQLQSSSIYFACSFRRTCSSIYNLSLVLRKKLKQKQTQILRLALSGLFLPSHYKPQKQRNRCPTLSNQGQFPQFFFIQRLDSVCAKRYRHACFDYFIGSVIHFWKLMFNRHESYLVCNCNLRKVFESYLLMIRLGEEKIQQNSNICSTRFDTLIVSTTLHENIFLHSADIHR